MNNEMIDNLNEKARREIGAFICRYGSINPDFFKEINYQNIDELSENAKDYIDIFPVYNTEEIKPEKVNILSQHEHIILKQGNSLFLADTRGHNCPRVIVRIK